MELTKEQLREVAFYLDKKELFYLDVRYEVLDHIISDIEHQLQDNVSFEEAFTVTKKKWEKQLELSSSLYTGLTYTKPKIVIEKAKNFMRFWYIITIFSVFLIPISKQSFISSLVTKPFEILVFTTVIISSFTIGFMYIKMKKLKTTFLFLFKTQVISVLILLPIILLDFNYSLNGNTNTNTVLFGIMIIAQACFGYKLYKNHARFSAKYLLK